MIIQADSRFIPLKDKTVNCIITSPPYWSLRKYDIPDLIWDGEEGCEHEWVEHIKNATHGEGFGDNKKMVSLNEDTKSNLCSKCSAWRGQLGLEPTIDLYLKHLLQIMDECKRVLRDDGTMWVNLGDSYGGNNSRASFGGRSGFGTPREGVFTRGLEKSLCLIPERFAIEMVNRGWILRNKLVWHKPNCMPSSVKDRFTVDFEPVFFFVKSKKYWFEQQYESQSDNTHARYSKEVENGLIAPVEARPESKEINRPGYKDWRKYTPKSFLEQGRNRRCVWTIPTQPYPESHFATFPEALIEPMIKAGCPQFVCKKCGKAREKIVDIQYKPIGKNPKSSEKSQLSHPRTIQDIELNRDCISQYRPQDMKYGRATKITKEIGLTDCGCNAGWKPGTVLDPCCGSGTVMKVAEKFQRKAIGIDLGYQELQEKRTEYNQIEMNI